MGSLAHTAGSLLQAVAGGSSHGRDSRRARRQRSSVLAWLLTLAAAGVAGIVLGGVMLSVLGAAVLAVVALVCGWRLGDHRRRALERQVDDRSGELRRVLSELEIAQAETVRRLSMAVEFRDEDTGAHIERIGRFSTLLSTQVGMDEEFSRLISHAAPLHDVGKVAIPDAILLKAGPLTSEERAIVETHAEEGYRLLRGSSSSILDMAAAIALSHHEKWDGSGYPRGLTKESIPLEGRIVAIADVFDALTSNRVYRSAFSVEEAVEMMVAQRGRHFDPVLLDAFLEVLDSSGADARAKLRADPSALLPSVREAYALALRRAEAEAAEEAIASAIEDGVEPIALHREVIGPALRHLAELRQAGEVDDEIVQRAATITRRILATIYRYMLGATEPHRERVLLLGADPSGPTLSLQMAHDQLAAAGFQAILEQQFAGEIDAEELSSREPQLVLIEAASPAGAEVAGALVVELIAMRPQAAVVVGGATSSRLVVDGEVTRVERLEESLSLVEELLAARQQQLR